MKLILVLIIAGLSLNVSWAEDYFYKVEENDQLGVIFLSLGHKKIWSKSGKINQFKRTSRLSVPRRFARGAFLKISESDILFKGNILIKNKYITFKKKIRNLAEFEEYEFSKNLTTSKEEQTTAAPAIGEVKEVTEQPTTFSHSLNLHPGIGGFVGSNKETDRSTTTSTFTGIQPVIQIKGIYSNERFGSLSFDLFAKKVFNNQFSFPVNLDGRLHFVPKWNFTDFFHFALSHSMIKHTYVGKSSSQEIPYELKSRFIGLGLVFPHDLYWFEIYLEKAYMGDTKSTELTQDVSKGWRMDSEIMYPVSTHWRILPGVNYYKVVSKQTEYSFSVFEARLILSREFEF